MSTEEMAEPEVLETEEIQDQQAEQPAAEQEAPPEDDGYEVLIDGATPASMPVASHIKQKQKWKARKEEAEKTAEALRRENELLRMQMEQSQQRKPLSRDDFDSDSAYENAVWEKRKKELMQEMQKNQPRTQQQPAEDDSDLDDYYARAAKLRVQDFDQAEDIVRSTFGDQATRELIRILPNSEAVIYALGKQPEKLREFEQTLRTRPAKFLADVTLFSTKVTTRPRNTKAPEPNALEEGANTSAASPQAQLDRLRDQVSKGKARFADVIAFRREQEAKGVTLI